MLYEILLYLEVFKQTLLVEILTLVDLITFLLKKPLICLLNAIEGIVEFLLKFVTIFIKFLK